MPEGGAGGGRERREVAAVGRTRDRSFTLATTPKRRDPPATTITAGDYYLPDDPSATVRYEPGAVGCTRAQYDELWGFADRIPPTPNPMNRHTNLRRKQATFGAVYRFGQQVSTRVSDPEDEWPELVKIAIEDSRSRIAEARRGDYEAATAAHVNWYPDGRAGNGRHRDAEPDLVPGAPIFSYSFLSDGPMDTASPSAAKTKTPAPTPRLFDVYRLGAQKPIASVPLGHGDVLVMAGTMQETHEHGVRPTAAKAHANQSRVNITVRAFKPGSAAVRTGGG